MTLDTERRPGPGRRRCSSRRPTKASVQNLSCKRRNTMKGKLLFLFVLATLASTMAVYAHHSFAATYDESKTITLEGRMVQFSFRNPHSFVQVEVDDAGQKVRWAIEWAGTAQLNNTGVQNDT